MRLFLLLLLTINLFAKKGDISSFFVYYGEDLPYDIAGNYDAIIVEPSNIETLTHSFRAYRDKIYAYVSIGETNRKNGNWILGKNGDWNSYIADISNLNYQNYLLNKIRDLSKKGYKNFFFDTLDSFYLVIKDKKEIKKEIKALANFVKRFKKSFPNSKLILNRGFDIIHEVHNLVDGFLVESLFYGLDTKNRTYKRMSDEDTKWLLNKLAPLQNYDFDIMILDYIRADEKELREKAVERIKNLGFIPFIGDYHLVGIGKSTIEPIKRELLVLYDSIALERGDKVYSAAHQIISTPIEYFGYIPILKDIRDGFDYNFDRYAGIVIFISDEPKEREKYYKWIDKAIKAGLKVLFLGTPSLPPSTYLKNLGIDVKKDKSNPFSKNQIIKQDKMIGYEIKPIIHHQDFLYTPDNATPLLMAKNSNGDKFTLSAITKWGGYVLNDSFYQAFQVKRDKDEINYLVIDYFQILKKALRLKPFPIPDVTTKNGRRMLFIHIDGDGFVSGVEFSPTLKLAGEEYYQTILQKYHLPHSISVIEAELAKWGVYPKFSKKAIEIAKKIYKLPYVLPASHTFSHPFVWSILEENPKAKGHNLPIPNYTFTPERELKGSLDFINRYLSPNRRAKTIFWSGDCLPSSKVLKYLNSQNFLAINGGGTKITKNNYTHTLITPIGIRRGQFYQIYASTENENVYTNDWTGPFWAYENVIQTFQLLDKPKRLKPIDIYYHFYIATKRASLNSLYKVYDWVLTQEINPIYVTEYIKKAHNFYYIAISKQKNRFILNGVDNLDTLRIPKELGEIDLKNSTGVYGFRDDYIHLNNKKRISLSFSKNPNNSNLFYLIDTNGEVKKFRDDTISLKANMPIVANFHIPKSCKILSSLKGYNIRRDKNRISISSKKWKSLEFNYQCE